MDHYRCQKLVSKDTNTEMVSDTNLFRHHKLALLSVTTEDKVLHGVQKLTAEIKNTRAYTVDAQLRAIKALKDNIEHQSGDKNHLPHCILSTRKNKFPKVPTSKPGTLPDPRVQAFPMCRQRHKWSKEATFQGHRYLLSHKILKYSSRLLEGDMSHQCGV